VAERIQMFGDEANGVFVGVRRDDESLVVLEDLQRKLDERAPAPRRRTGNVNLDTLDSFIAHVNRYKSDDSVVFADQGNGRLVAVFNYHPAGADHASAGWADHRAVYACPKSDSWIAWSNRAGDGMSKHDFAQFLDDHREDIVTAEDYPNSAAMLEMVRKLHVKTKGEYRDDFDQVTGERTLILRSEHEESSTKIHRAFLLGIPIYRGGKAYYIEVRIQFRIKGDAGPVFSYTLHDAAKQVEQAFSEVTERVRAEAVEHLYFGTI
jgi:uncharacterized protein YfdQ (DUF2303 family)